MKIVFVVGSLALSGGNYVTIQHAVHAQQHGHEVTIASVYPSTDFDLTWHPGLSILRRMSIESLVDESFDLAIATWWRTALHLDRLVARQYCYFVQSIESRFFPVTALASRRMVERTYEIGLPTITEASWIRQYLKEMYGCECHLARNGIRKDLYTRDAASSPKRRDGRISILVEGPFGVAIKNTSRTINIVKRAKVGDVVLLTSTDLKWYPGTRLYSRVPIADVGAIYRSCDVIVKLSLVEGMFGPPLEMFHCGGTAVVYDVSGHDEYIVHGENALVARMNDEDAVIEHLRQLRDDPSLLRRLKAGAASTADLWPDWIEASAVFIAKLEEVASSESFSRDRLLSATSAIRQEYAMELFAPSVRSPAEDRRGLSARVLRIAKDRLAPYKRIWKAVAEGC